MKNNKSYLDEIGPKWLKISVPEGCVLTNHL